MPIYEYVCQDCGDKFEKFIHSRLAKIEINCPTCGSEKADKAFSAFSTRGSGSGSGLGYSPSSAPACGPVG